MVANPDTPERINREGRAYSSSVQHVVIRDETRRVVVQPRFKDEFQEEVQNAMGAKLAYQGVRAVFSMEELKGARDRAGEFIITVVGEREKDFKVKTKHLPELPGLAK